jgi:O-antigen ligase
MGVERVMLSPLFGIKLSNKSDDDRIINFCCPHNEFIAYWTFMGTLGLLSYFILISSLIRKNKNSKNALFWYLLYFALIVQMFFDSAFQNVRFIPLFFILVGINISELKINKF